MHKLAIIIPAYKITFLEKALASIANQTCKNFTLYVGDDASPDDLFSIVKKYMNDINIIYHRFEENIGSKDLVAQWERCIALSKTEEWLWLFSDDDEMDPLCVEKFYEQIKQHENNTYDVYHFNVKIIDENSNILSVPKKYPKIIKSFDFYKAKMFGKIESFVVENIFPRNIYNKTGGFQNFDLAWGSDIAAWIKFGQHKGIFTIDNAWIKWRKSAENITPDKSKTMMSRKIKAINSYYSWSFSSFRNKKYSLMYINFRTYISRMRHYYKYVPDKEIWNSVDVFIKNYKLKPLLKYLLILLVLIKNKKVNA